MNLLTIGGSDPSSGAGIQNDIRVFSTFNIHALTVITAITSQNTSSFGMVEPVSEKILKKQIDSILSDFKIDGIKIGMVYNSNIIKIINQKLKKLKIPIVVDPVIKSTTGGDLIEKNAIKDFQKYIIPLATIITPNKFEAEILSKLKINSKNSPEKIASVIQKMGAKNVVITGIELTKNNISDIVIEKNQKYSISSKKIKSINHGSGCIYSAILLMGICKKNTIKESLRLAKQYTLNSIKNAKNIGKGIAITSIEKDDSVNLELSNAIDKFAEIKNIYKNIPECQTNFVFSKPNPKTTKDVLGVAGRIVKVGKKVIIAGDLEYGGSKHVATALLAMNKKYSHICSAVNIKFDKITMSKIKKSKMHTLSYDRSLEPKGIKLKGSSIEWGIKKSISKSKKTPDIIYHKGDVGKEPMILVFAETPNNVLKKILKII